MLDIVQIPVLQDNYLYLIHDPKGETAIVDPALAEPVNAVLDERGWKLTHIINTHHHWDHTGANLELKEQHGLTIVGPTAERDRIPGLDIAVGSGDTVTIGDSVAKVMDVPGHTAGHIAYHFAEDKALFCGDTLFSLGCGRLFEGTPDQMWHSLSQLMALPDETAVYCAHEYTAANAAFAETIDGDNPALKARISDIIQLRKANKPTIPTTIGLEKATNPFLRPMDPGVQAGVALLGQDPVTVFAEVRRRKDTF